MWLLTKLKTALQALETAQNLQGEVRELRQAVEALEGEQLRREMEWRETKDQVLRHLKRVQAIKQHEDAAVEEPGRPSQATVLAMKYNRGGS